MFRNRPCREITHHEQRRATRGKRPLHTDWQGDATEGSDHAGDLLDGGGPPPGPVTSIVSASAAVVTLGGEHDVSSRDAIAEAFGVAATGRDLFVDLSECSFIDSTIIKLLLRTMRALEDRDGRLELVIDTAGTGHVARVAELMGIAGVTPTHSTRSDGIRSLASGRAFEDTRVIELLRSRPSPRGGTPRP